MASGPQNINNLNVPGGGGRGNFLLWWLQNQAKDKGTQPRAAAGMNKVDWQNMAEYEKMRLTMQDQARANAYQNQDYLETQQTARGMADREHNVEQLDRDRRNASEAEIQKMWGLNPEVMTSKHYKAEEMHKINAEREAAKASGEAEATDTSNAPEAEGEATTPTAPPDRAPRTYRDAPGGDFPDVVFTGKSSSNLSDGTRVDQSFVTPLEEKLRRGGGPADPKKKGGKKADAEDQAEDQPTEEKPEPEVDNRVFAGAKIPVGYDVGRRGRMADLTDAQHTAAEEQWPAFRQTQVESVGEENWDEDYEAMARDTYLKQMFPITGEKGPAQWRYNSSAFARPKGTETTGRWSREDRGGPAKPPVKDNEPESKSANNELPPPPGLTPEELAKYHEQKDRNNKPDENKLPPPPTEADEAEDKGKKPKGNKRPKPEPKPEPAENKSADSEPAPDPDEDTAMLENLKSNLKPID